MDITHEISKLLQYSPKRANQFKDIQVNMCDETAGFRILCPTRWTVRNETFVSIIDNYTVLLELWSEILDENIESEVRARVNGVLSQMVIILEWNLLRRFCGIQIISVRLSNILS